MSKNKISFLEELQKISEKAEQNQIERIKEYIKEKYLDSIKNRLIAAAERGKYVDGFYIEIDDTFKDYSSILISNSIRHILAIELNLPENSITFNKILWNINKSNDRYMFTIDWS